MSDIPDTIAWTHDEAPVPTRGRLSDSSDTLKPGFMLGPGIGP